MEGRRLTVRERTIVYYPAGVEIVELVPEIGNLRAGMQDLTIRHTRLRRIVVRFRPQIPMACFFLHWSDGRDLRDADDEIIATGSAGVITRDKAALAGEFMRTKCMSCKKSQYVIREMSPFPIFDDERERRAEHAYHKTCPNCGNFWDPLILEPLGPVED